MIEEIATQDAQRHERLRQKELDKMKKEAAERARWRKRRDASPVNEDFAEHDDIKLSTEVSHDRNKQPPEDNFY